MPEARFDKAFLKTLDEHVLVSDVVKDFVALKKVFCTPPKSVAVDLVKYHDFTAKQAYELTRPHEEWRGDSPFTEDCEPHGSLVVKDEKHFYHDFASGKHGDTIGFLMEMGRTYHAAVLELAKRYGVDVRYKKADAD